MLMQEHYAYIRRLANSILNDSDEADDAAQETFIAAQRSLADFRGEASQRTWLTKITLNNCRGRLRRLEAHKKLHQALQALHLQRQHVADVEQQSLQREADREVWRAVDQLDEKHRLPVILRYVHELSAAEIAAILEVDIGTVHSRLFYARQKLQELLKIYHHAADGPFNGREEAT